MGRYFYYSKRRRLEHRAASRSPDPVLDLPALRLGRGARVARDLHGVRLAALPVGRRHSRRRGEAPPVRRGLGLPRDGEGRWSRPEGQAAGCASPGASVWATTCFLPTVSVSAP